MTRHRDRQPEAPTFSMSMIGQNGDLILRGFKNGDLEVTVRNVADTESIASVRLTHAQAGLLGSVVDQLELPLDDDGD